MAVVLVSYYTDPSCPWSWALEPALRKLTQELGQSLRFNHVMCGMAREFQAPEAIIRDQLEAADATGMPVDPRLWLEGPPRSSYPACIAVKAAAEQGADGAYLRRLREGFLCRRRKLDVADALVEEARSVRGVDVERFRIDLGSHAILEAFGLDLERAAAAAPEHQQPRTGRVKLPSLEFEREDGSKIGLYGYVGYEQLRGAALAAGAAPGHDSAPTVEQALARFGSMATAEVASVCDLPGPRAPAELWRLATGWRVRAERVGSGELWTAA